MTLMKTFTRRILDILGTRNVEKQGALPKDFNAAAYLKANPDVAASGADPHEHFLKHGMFEGRTYIADETKFLPPDFEAKSYLALNPDLLSSQLGPEEHYVEYGRYEQRRYRLERLTACYGYEPRSDLETVLIVSHDASRTGAPVLSWNLVNQFRNKFNVVVLLLGNGSILDSFQTDAYATYVYPEVKPHPGVADIVLAELAHRHKIRLAIVNSAEASSVCRPLTLNGIPSICLIHEFASSSPNLAIFENAARWASKVVFSTSITRQNALQVTGLRRFADADIIPQGRCLVPGSTNLPEISKPHPIDGILERLEPEQRLVVGLGSVCYRKGVDTFIECARQMFHMPDGDKFRFVWIGSGLSPAYEPPYAMLLPDQIDRAGLSSVLSIVDDTSNLDVVYDRADVLLLTSRLDPLPNVAIDALHLGLPVVCFDHCSGIAEALKKEGIAQDYVAPYYDVGAFARLASAVASHKRSGTGVCTLMEFAQKEYSIANYGQLLLSFSSSLRRELSKLASDANTIHKSGLFDLDYYLGSPGVIQPAARQSQAYECIFKYCIESRQGLNHRKPRPGFHPLAFSGLLMAADDTDPFALYAGLSTTERAACEPFLPKVITPLRTEFVDQGVSERVALHIHVHYLDLLPDILARLKGNRTRPDLFITATDNAPLAEIYRELEKHHLDAKEVALVTNHGRNILPLYRFLQRMTSSYDIVGHVHTKKSAFHQQQDAISRWRELVLCNTLGSADVPNMLDQILARLHDDSQLDIIFPDDPNILDWGNNYELAGQMMTTSSGALVKHFEFPVSAMFWARSRYLEQFTSLPLLDTFSLHEPLPNDGTLLHAFERALGALLAKTPSSIGLTFTPGVYR